MGCSESRSAEKPKDACDESFESHFKLSKEVQFQIYDCILSDDTQRLAEGIKNRLPVDVKLDNFANRTILHIACEQGSEKITEMVVRYGCQVDLEDDYGITPIFLATIKNHIRCVEILKEAGAKISDLSQSLPEVKDLNVVKKLRAA